MQDAISDRVSFHYYKKTIVAAAFRDDVAVALHRARVRLELAQHPDIIGRKRDELRQPAGKRKCSWNRRHRRCASHLEPPVRSQCFVTLPERYGRPFSKSNALAERCRQIIRNDDIP
jgi:hypothetical protein